MISLAVAAFCVAGFAIRVRADRSIRDGFLTTALILSTAVLVRSAP